MPDTIQFVSGNQILNRYAADGRKLGTEYITKLTPIILPIDKDTVCNWSIGSGLITQIGTAYIDNKEYNTTNGNPYLNILSRVHNTEGYISYNTSPYTGYIYNRTDHLGNIREVWHASSKTTIQRTQYYASGLPWATTLADNLTTQPYKYNGKEFIEMNGYDTYDYGARGYYAASGRFMSVDPHTEKYYSISPYVYCKNNPVNAIDPDGKLVIFVNGNHYGSGGKSEYWDGFDKAVMNRVDDHKAIYKDGSLGGWAPFNMRSENSREYFGYLQGETDAPSIINAISNSKGEITETIKVISHSMGGAFSKGYIKAILEYAKFMGITVPFIAFEADFAPFESSKQTAVRDRLMGPTFQYSHNGDPIAGNKPELGAQQQNTSNDENQTHWIGDFMKQVATLPAGNYKVVNGQIVPQ